MELGKLKVYRSACQAGNLRALAVRPSWSAVGLKKAAFRLRATFAGATMVGGKLEVSMVRRMGSRLLLVLMALLVTVASPLAAQQKASTPLIPREVLFGN